MLGLKACQVVAVVAVLIPSISQIKALTAHIAPAHTRGSGLVTDSSFTKHCDVLNSNESFEPHSQHEIQNRQCLISLAEAEGRRRVARGLIEPSESTLSSEDPPQPSELIQTAPKTSAGDQKPRRFLMVQKSPTADKLVSMVPAMEFCGDAGDEPPIECVNWPQVQTNSNLSTADTPQISERQTAPQACPSGEQPRRFLMVKKSPTADKLANMIPTTDLCGDTTNGTPTEEINVLQPKSNFEKTPDTGDIKGKESDSFRLGCLPVEIFRPLAFVSAQVSAALASLLPLRGAGAQPNSERSEQQACHAQLQEDTLQQGRPPLRATSPARSQESETQLPLKVRQESFQVEALRKYESWVTPGVSPAPSLDPVS